MADQPIDSNEVIQSGLFDDAIKGANEWLAINKELEEQLRKNLSVTKDLINSQKINDSKALESQAKAAQEAAKELAQLEKVEQERIKVEQLKQKLEQEAERTEQQRIRTTRERTKQELEYNKQIEAQEKANDKALKAAMDLNSEYRKSVTRLADLKKQLKELVITGQQNTVAYRNLSVEFRNLDARVREAEESVGEFQRNVGNYGESISETFTSIGETILAVFSVDAIISFGQKILETRAEFQKFEAVLKNTLGSDIAAANALERIQVIAAKTPFSVKTLTESYVKLVNQGIKPTNKEIIALGDLASSQGKEFDQLTEAIIDAQTGEFERLKEFGIKASKSGDQVSFTFKGVKTTVKNTSDEITKYIIGLGDLKGVTGGMAAISETLGGQISNLGDGFDTFFNNLGKNSQGVFSIVLSQFGELLNKTNEIGTAAAKTNSILNKAGVKEGLFDGDKLAAYQNVLDNVGKSEVSVTKKVSQLHAVNALINKQYATGVIDLETYRNGLLLVENAAQSLRQTVVDDQQVKKKDTALTEDQIKALKDLKKAQEDLENKLIKARIDNTELDKRREIYDAKNKARLSEQQLNEEREKLQKFGKGTRALTKDEEDKLAALKINVQESLRQEIVKINDKYNEIDRKKAQEEADTIYKDLKYGYKKTREEIAKEEQEFQAKLTLIDTNSNGVIERNNKELADRKARREKERKEQIAFAQQTVELASQQEAKLSQIRQDALTKEINDRQTAIDIQRRLAENGQANTLAFEEEQKRKEEVRLEQEKKKEIQRQKALAFFKAFTSNLDHGDSVILAASKAAAGIALADAIAGSFFKGTEKVEDDLKGNKLHNGRDGYRIAVDGSERILTGDQNKMVGNMTNEELARLAYDYRTDGLLAGANINATPKVKSESMSDSSPLIYQIASMNAEIRDLKSIIKNRPVSSTDFSPLGDFIRTEIKNGFKKVTTYKLPRI